MLLCIPDCKMDGCSAQEVVISHSHSILAHLGLRQTLVYLRDHVWWKKMTHNVQAYIDSCATCKHSKPSNQKPYGLLNPLAPPSSPWEAIGVDFVGPLPNSRNCNASFNMICVIIDLLTGTVHLIPGCLDYKAKEMAELIFTEIYKHYVLPAQIVSDRDMLFTSTFWKHLHSLLGVELCMSSAYHPETDQLMERANRTVTTMLRQCVCADQMDWVSRLLAIEFSVNSAHSELTGYALFFLNMGCMPCSMIWDAPKSDKYPSVRVYAQKMKQVIMEVHDSILEACVKQTCIANCNCHPVPFTKGDFVYISIKNMALPKGQARKLTAKYIGPYKIINDFGNSLFRVVLPDQLQQCSIHNVFHALLLCVHIPNNNRLFPGHAETQVTDFEDPSSEWYDQKILSHYGSDKDSIFKVLWTSGNILWLPWDAVCSLIALKEYLSGKGVPGSNNLGAGTGTSPHDNPQVFSGQMGVGKGRRASPYKNQHSPSRPLHPTLSCLSRSCYTQHHFCLFPLFLLPTIPPLDHDNPIIGWDYVHKDSDV